MCFRDMVLMCTYILLFSIILKQGYGDNTSLSLLSDVAICSNNA